MMQKVFQVLVPLLIVGCGLEQRMDDFNAQLAAMRQAMLASADTLAKSIPGERYQRLIEDAHGTDPVKKQAAQAFIKSLFNVDIDVPYSVGAYFLSAGEVPAQVDLFWAETPDVESVRAYLAGANLNLADPLFWDPKKPNFQPPGGPLLPGREIPWNPVGEKAVLVLIVRETDLDRLPGLRIRALLRDAHAAGVPELPGGFGGTRPYEFTKASFLLNEPVTDPQFGRLRWAAHNMAQVDLLKQEILDARQNVKKLLSAWEKLSASERAENHRRR